jgi:hypothetical protein
MYNVFIEKNTLSNTLVAYRLNMGKENKMPRLYNDDT